MRTMGKERTTTKDGAKLTETPAIDKSLWEIESDGSTTRRTRRRAQRVNDLLKETALVVAEKGYHNASLDEIAERLDLAKPSIYHYFDSKDELIYECLSTCALHLTSRLRAVAEQDLPAAERLRAMIVRQLEVISVEHPELSHLFLHPLDWPPAIEEALATWRKEHDAIFKLVIVDGVDAGDLAPLSASIARMSLHGALNYVPLWLRRNTRGQAAAIQTVADTVMAMFERR